MNIATPLAIIDTETTGIAKYDQVIELAIVLADHGQVTDRWHTLIRPTVPINPRAMATHCITPEQLINSPDFGDTIASIDLRLRGRTLVAHNASFDIRMLNQEYSRHGRLFGDICQQAVCTCAMARQLSGGLENRKLGTLARHYGIDQGTAHRALDDTLVCHAILQAMLADGIAACPVPIKRQHSQPAEHTGKVFGLTRGLTSFHEQLAQVTQSDHLVGKNIPACIKGRNVVVTGTLEGYTRNDAHALIVQLGATVKTSVSGKVHLLVKGNGAGNNKLAAAKKHDVPIIEGAVFLTKFT